MTFRPAHPLRGPLSFAGRARLRHDGAMRPIVFLLSLAALALTALGPGAGDPRLSGFAAAAQAQEAPVAAITPEALAWLEEAERFLVRLPPAEAPPGPLLRDDDRSPAARLLRGWLAEGRAAGLSGVLYDNRDRGHSPLPRTRFGQITHLEYAPALQAENLDLGLAGPFLFDAWVLGNSSTAVTSGPGARGLPRLAMTTEDGPARAAQTAFADHLYVYPAWRDHDALDLLPANWAYFVATQGASYTDAPFLEAFALTMASFTPEVRARIARDRLLVPTLQMILRRALAGVTRDEVYLSGWAHPAVFDGARLRPGQMMAIANRLTPETVPPRVLIDVVSEDFADAAGLMGLSERLFDTPGAVARLWRGWQGRREVVLSAGAQPGGVERFEWVVLQGDAARVRITPLDARGGQARIVIDWHDRRPATPRGDRATDRVDIGVFAWNGVHYSAPAFFTVAFPGHERRIHAPGPDGAPQLVSVDYDAAARGAAYDPWLHFSAPWRDVARRDSQGVLIGWDRAWQGTRLTLDLDGGLADGRRAHYVVDETGPQDATVLRLELRAGDADSPGSEVE